MCYGKDVGTVQLIKEDLLRRLGSQPPGTWVSQGIAIGGLHDGLRHLILLEDEELVERKTKVTRSSIRFFFRIK